MPKRRRWHAVVLSAVWLIFLSGADANDLALHAPTVLPQVTVQDASGARHALSEMLGQPMVILVWGTDCATCMDDLASLARLRKNRAFDRLSIIPLAVDRGESANVATLYLAQGLTSLPIFFDATGGAARSLGIARMPSAVLIDAQGRDVGHYEGSLDWTSPATITILDALLGSSRDSGA